MRAPPCRLLRVAALLASICCSHASAQADRLLGVVQTADGAPLPAVRVRALSLASSGDPWGTPAAGAIGTQPIETRTDERGRFSLPLDTRAALWIEGETLAAFVPEAAPGVPAIVRAAPSARVELPDGARGAHVRLCGVPVGFVEGVRLELPAVAAELLVEASERAFTAQCELRAGERCTVRASDVAPARIVGLPAGAFVSLLSWPDRRFDRDADGAVELPVSSRPTLVRVTAPRGGDWSFDETWLEPGRESRFAPSARWATLRVVDGADRPIAGAEVRTMRAGPGIPAALSVSATDASGLASYRVDAESMHVSVDADGFASRNLVPIDLRDADADGALAVRLDVGHSLRVVVFGEHGQSLAGAFVTIGTERETRRCARADERGVAVVPRLPRGDVTIAIEHDGYVPLVVDVAVPAAAPLEYVLDIGSSVRGKVNCADAVVLSDVLVEAREPRHWLLRRAPRVTAAADGSFVIRGLSGGPVDVSAHRVEHGVTWSGVARGVLPGDAPVTVAIRCDDPQPDSR